MTGIAGKAFDWLFTPISVATTAVHWLVVVFALYGPDNAEQSAHSSLLTILYAINVVPLAFAGMIAMPFIGSVGGWLWYGLAMLLYFVLVSLQWLLIGKGTGWFVRNFVISSRIE